MVDTEMYAEIQKRKRAGYSQRAVARELDLDRKTVRRYWDMTEDKYAQYLLNSKSRTKILDPYRDYLKPVPTLAAPVIPKTAAVRKTNVIHYLRYEVPRGTYFLGRMARIEADVQTGRVMFYDAKSNELLAGHDISYSKGRFVSLPKNGERFKSIKYEDLKTKVLKSFGEMPGAEEFIAKIMELYPRYIRDQLSIISKSQKQYDRPELERALQYCQQRELFSANDFRDTLEYFREAEPMPVLKPLALPVKYSTIRAEIRPVSAYTAMMDGGETL